VPINTTTATQHYAAVLWVGLLSLRAWATRDDPVQSKPAYPPPEDAPESETAADAPDAKDSDKSDAQASDKKRSPLIRSKTCLVLSPQAQSTTPLTTFTTPPLKSGRRHQRPTRPGDDQPQEPKTPVSPFSPSTSRMRPTKPSATSSMTRSSSALFASESGADGVSSPMRGDRRSVQAKCPRQSSGSRFYSHVVLQGLKHNAQQLSGYMKEEHEFSFVRS